MTRRRAGAARATSPGEAPYRDPLRPSRPGWVRGVVLLMVLALVLSVVGGFISALA